MEQTLGKRIVQHRKRLGMTQDKLAEHLGVTAQAVSKWENDQACPDITMLPKLAEIFGISADVLLGLKEEEEQVYVAEPVTEDSGHGDHGNVEFKMNWDNGRKGTLGFALWILATGGLLLAANILNRNAGFWDILWPTGLLIFGLFGLFPDFSFFRLGCALFGAYSLADCLNFAPFQLGKELILPALLLIFGLSLLADALKRPRRSKFTVTSASPRNHGKFKSHCTMEGTHFICATSFGEDHRTITLPSLSSGEASVSFGELTVDLTGCGSIANGCHIDASCSFGELKVLIPRSCRVEPTSRTAFADVECHGHSNPDATATITMDCNANFGEISIRYI